MEQNGVIDPFSDLVKKNGSSCIAVGFTKWVGDVNGGVTVKFECTLTCDQDEPTINRAAHLAAEKAMEVTTTLFAMVAGRQEQENSG